MKNYCAKTDLFYGSGKIDLPQPCGVAKSWHFIKAICGNTHPAAMHPFGRLSVGCYSNGYPTGYGNHRENSCPSDFKTYDGNPKCFGFSHIHQSGTGAIDVYYNYAVVTPFYGVPYDSTHGFTITEETAKPGYYSLVLSENSVKCEMTSGDCMVAHRYSFTKNGGKIMIDLSNDGLKSGSEKSRGYSQKSYIHIIGNGEFEASVIMKGIPLYIYGVCSNSEKISIMRDYLLLNNCDTLELGKVMEDFGVCFETPEAGEYELRLSISTVSFEKARQDVNKKSNMTFDEIADEAYKVWNKTLGKIEIEAESKEKENIFYSNLYHSLVKPSDWSGENFLSDENDFVLDFATLWDVYKTQLPLIFTLYPEISKKIIASFLTYCDKAGIMPHTFLLTKIDELPHSTQARMLAEYSIYDAYVRGIKADYHHALETAKTDLNSELFDDFHKMNCTRYTFVLDITEGCRAMKELADMLGEDGREFEKSSVIRQEIYDKKTGIMSEKGDYYEGSEWNYSFRPMRDMNKRIAEMGGKEKFLSTLDRFFGFTDSEDTSRRFEGFNNETDMETFLSYYYVGRSDRICEITSAAIKSMFTTGRGGLPGNNDSGGITSCYIWLASGIFPVAGQNLMIIGSPDNKKTVFHLNNGKDFTIEKSGNGIYVSEAYLNEKKLEKLSFSVTEMMNGGKLLLIMSEKA